MITFFDTETTSKADFRSPPDAPHQPRLVQFAALLCDDAGEEVSSVSIIIKPNGFTIPEEASKIHGITTEIANARGALTALWRVTFIRHGGPLPISWWRTTSSSICSSWTGDGSGLRHSILGHSNR